MKGLRPNFALTSSDVSSDIRILWQTNITDYFGRRQTLLPVSNTSANEIENLIDGTL